MANKRTKMLSFNVRISPEDPAGSIQKQIDELESQGHYVMQYIPISPFAGVMLAHDYPDKKNFDDDEAAAKAKAKREGKDAPEAEEQSQDASADAEPKANESAEQAAPQPEAKPEPDPVIESAKEMAKNRGSKGPKKGKSK